MNPKSQQIEPLLQREIASHHPATSVSAILTILSKAEQGDLIAQAELFADMEERDAHLYAEMTKRKMAISQLDWCLDSRRDAGAREKKDVKNIELMIRDIIDIDTLIFDMADAIGQGFAALEIEWKRDPSIGWWIPNTITARPQRWFTVDQATRQQIRLRSMTNMDGDELVPYGWILHQHSSKTGYPATRGLYRALALPYLFKNFAVKNWLRFCELYAVPMRMLMVTNKTPEQKKELLTAMQAMGANGVAILDGIFKDDFNTVDAATGEGQGFMALVEWCERSISKAILGGTLTSETGKNGNYATALVHDDARYQIRDNDARQIAETLTRQLVGAITAVNGVNLTARWTFDTREPEDMALYADAIPKLVAVGAKITTQYLHEKLKIPLPEEGEAVLSAPGNSSEIPNSSKAGLSAGQVNMAADKPVFTPAQQAIEDLADSLVNALDSPIKTDLIASAIRAATDPEDLEQRLAAVLKEADVSEFTKVLEKALFAADIMGYAHAT